MRRHRILIVEDDELMRAVYKSIFRRCQDEFELRQESDGEGALNYLAGNRPDAVLLDWDMPGMSGLDVLKAIRADCALRTVPIFIISGRSTLEDKAMALASGASDCLSKPFEPPDLLNGLRHCLGSVG